MANPEVTLAEVRARFNEFSSVDDDVVERTIETAGRITAVSKDAKLYCTAHILTTLAEETGSADGGSGVVSSERIGPKTVEYETQAMNGREVFFATTAYGRMVLAIEKRNPKRIFSVVVA